MDQICIMNADGTGFRRLTTEDNIQHFYPSLSPDGQSVLYAGFREQNVYEIYKLDLADGSVDRLTNRIGVKTGPEFSPDGERIVFARNNPRTQSVPAHGHGSQRRGCREYPAAVRLGSHLVTGWKKDPVCLRPDGPITAVHREFAGTAVDPADEPACHPRPQRLVAGWTDILSPIPARPGTAKSTS